MGNNIDLGLFWVWHPCSPRRLGVHHVSQFRIVEENNEIHERAQQRVWVLRDGEGSVEEAQKFRGYRRREFIPLVRYALVFEHIQKPINGVDFDELIDVRDVEAVAYPDASGEERRELFPAFVVPAGP